MSALLARHSRSIWLAVALLTLGGLLAATKLPVSLFPHIDYPRVVVAVDAGDRDAAQMAAEITRPIETALRAVPGVTRIRSTTSRGSAEVALNFDWGDDMAQATLATQGAIATILPDLPAGTRFEVRRSDPTIFPVLGIALTSDTLDQQALRQIAQLKVLPALSTVPGVAGVDILGGSPREFAVDVDPGRLQALGLTLPDVAAAIGKANSVRGVGKMEDRHRLYLVLVENRIASAADIAAIPVKAGQTSAAGLVTLGQIARIHPAAEPNFTKVNSNGRDAVLVNVRQSLTGDTVTIVKAVAARLGQAGLPPSVKATPFYDQSELVTGAADAVRDAIILGAILAGLVLFLFLRSGRLMLITGLMLPAVLAATCLALLALHMSFNMMTLGGMAAAVGLVVDDAVVMLEHVMRRMQEGEAKDPPTLLDAAAEMARPLVGSTLATIIVFLPLAFISGVTGGFFQALAVTMVAALAVSLLYARYVIPLIAAYWLRDKDAEAAERAGGFMERLHRWYGAAGDRAFGHPVLFAGIVAAALAVLGVFAWSHVPSGFMPAMDEGGFVLDYRTAPGTALTETDRVLRQVEAILRATPDVASYSRRTGAGLGGGLNEANEGDFFVRLKPSGRRPVDQVMDDIRGRVEHEVPGIDVEMAQLMEDLIGDLTAVPQPVEIKIFGDRPDALAASARAVAARLGKIDGVVDVKDGINPAGDALDIRVDPARAALEGMDADAVTRYVSAVMSGTVATRVPGGVKMVDVRVWVPKDQRATETDLRRLRVVAPDGHAFPLQRVAEIHTVTGQAQITRENLKRMVAVTARISGRDLGSVIADVRTMMSRRGTLPADSDYRLGGLYEQQQIAFHGLMAVFAAAAALVFLLLLFMYESFRLALSILITALLAVSAVFIGLWLTRIELNISAMMGMTMIIGMATEVAIFYYSEQQELAGTMPREQALLEAGLNRMRPIAMTTLAAILTLLPLAFALGHGSEMQQPLAVAIISGLVVQLPLVLLFMPVLFHLMRPWSPDRPTTPSTEETP